MKKFLLTVDSFTSHLSFHLSPLTFHLFCLMSLICNQAFAQNYESVPYSTGFEGLSTGSLPSGWTAPMTGSSDGIYPSVDSAVDYARNGNACLVFATGSSSQTEVVVLPPTWENINILKLDFWASTLWRYQPTWFEVGVWNSTSETFTPVDTISLLMGGYWGDYNEYTVDFSDYYGDGDRIAMRASGTYRLLIDDVTVSENNFCYPLSSLYSINSDTGSLSIGWVDLLNTDASYTVSYWFDGSTDTVTVSVDTTTFTVSGLEGLRTYHFSVVPNCPLGDGTPISNTFTTPCPNTGCNFMVAMADSDGDGWNGNASLSFVQNNITMGFAKLSSGSSDTVTVHVCDGYPLSYSWVRGYFDSECSYIIYDGAGGEVYNSSTDGVNHSDTLAESCPTCIIATDLTVDSVYDDNISFSWNSDNTASGYSIYLDGEYVDWSIDTSYTFTGLNRNSCYSLGVRKLCSSDDSARLASVVAYSACGPMALPSFENFEKFSNVSWPPCWHRLLSHGSFPYVGTPYHYSGKRSIILEASEDTLLFCTPSPIPTAGNNIYVRYRTWLSPLMMRRGTKWLKAGVMTDTSDISTFIVLDSVDGHNAEEGFEEREFLTLGLDSTATYWVAWIFYSAENFYHGWGDNRGAVDDIYISEIPSCFHVTSIRADSVTAESILLSWDNNDLNIDTNFIVSCWSDTGDTITVTTNDTFYLFDGLASNSLYTFSVAVTCDESLAMVASFRTECSPLAIPYVEGFEGQSEEMTPDCWKGMGGEVNVIAGGMHSGERRLDFRGGLSTVAVLPQFEIEANRLQLKFWTRPEFITAGCGTFSVGYVTEGGDESSCTVLESYSYADFGSGYRMENVLFVDAPAGARMAFRHEAGSPYYWWFVDDVEVDTLPSCLPVKQLEVSNVAATDATLHWIPREGQSIWFIKVGDSIYTTTDTNYILTGLSPHTPYTAHVATLCGSDTSMWKSINFKTLCATGSGYVTVAMASRWNGGWNGSAVNILQNGILVGSTTLSSGRSDTASVEVCCGTPVTFSWDGGPYSHTDYDCSYIIYDDNMGEVYNSAHGGVARSGTVSNVCANCQVPVRVKVVAVDSTSITIAWDTVGSVYGYLISIDSGTYIPCDSGSITFSGLAEGSEHTFSVITLCSSTDASNTVTLVETTTCGSQEIPMKENFENSVTHSAPECWYVVSGIPAIESYAIWHSDYKSLSLPKGSTIATRRVPLPGDMIGVDFWAANYGRDTLEAGVMTNLADESTFIPLVACTGTDDEFMHFEFNTRSLPHDSIYYIAFRSTSGIGYIDDVQIFEDTSIAHYTVTVSTDNPEMGSVTGSGRYVANYNVTLTATANPGYHFADWDDEVTDSVRTVTVTGDMSFVARFTENVGIPETENPGLKVDISPNPAHDKATIRVSEPSVLSVIDITGRIVIPDTPVSSSLIIHHSSLPSGAYFLRIATATETITKKLIIR